MGIKGRGAGAKLQVTEGEISWGKGTQRRIPGLALRPDLKVWANVGPVESGSAMHLPGRLYQLTGIAVTPLFHIKTNNSLFPEGICLVREQY